MDLAHCNTSSTVQAGDVVLLFVNRLCMVPVTVTPHASSHAGRGHYYHSSIIGQPFGSTVKSTTSETCRVLKITPELWTGALSHRTQIMYLPDISVIIGRLHLRPGSRVVEAGTGSGSLTHSLIRSVAPNGHVFTFEFHEGRAQSAKEDFERHGLCSLVTSNHRDVIDEGFLLDEALPPHTADALFLDVPSPWKAIHHVFEVLVPNAVFCSFSPSAEQIQKTLSSISSHGGFVLPQVIAVQCFPYDLKPLTTKKTDRFTNETSDLLDSFASVLPTNSTDDSSYVHKKTGMDRLHTGYLLFIRKGLDE
ncbi:hypothetical protein P9112_006834 [Eukaryota sp. TZLM1-RC]